MQITSIKPAMNTSILNWQYEPSGEHCLILSLPDDPAPYRTLAQLAVFLQHPPLFGVCDIVPASHSVGIYYQPHRFWHRDPSLSPYQQLVKQLTARLAEFTPHLAQTGREVVIPVCYAAEYALDLPLIAQQSGLSVPDVIAHHQACIADVIMLGFLPGLPYLGGLDTCFMSPRRATPRMRVEQGAVGVANGMGVIYPQASPGGWNIIGRTPLMLFTASHSPPCLLQAGDRVRFQAISRDEFRQWEGNNDGN